ncbi:e3 ubiquitin-protein ligase RNF13 [Trichonephila clavipes]|nr:e3 ubiquitin-protein ligase RNF13 [Trichonephila clavipes]
MTLHTITPAVEAVCRCKAKEGLRHSSRGLHTRTRLSSLLKLNLDSSLKTIWFPFVAVQSRRARHHSKQRLGGWVSLTGPVMSAAIPDILQPGALRRFGKTQRPIVMVLSVSGQRSIRQLVLHLRVV